MGQKTGQELRDERDKLEDLSIFAHPWMEDSYEERQWAYINYAELAELTGDKSNERNITGKTSKTKRAKTRKGKGRSS